MKKYYLAYCRKSTRPDDRQAASLPRQIKEVGDFAKKNKLQILKTFKESGSAWIDGDNRPEFGKMIDLAWERDDIKGIISFDTSRLGRNDSDSGALKKLIIRGRIDHILTTVGETFDDNNIESLGIKNLFDSSYSQKISKNVRASIKDRVSNGIPPYGTLPPGYAWDNLAPKGQKKPILTHDWPLLRKVFELFMTGNYSVAGLWREVDKMGIQNSKGRIISKTRLYQLLGDPFYKGYFRVNGQEITTPGAYEPMLTDTEFDLVQQILTGKSKPRQHRHQFALNGLVRCGECGMWVTGESHTKKYKNGKTQTFTYYRCTKKAKNKKCTQMYIREKELEEQLADTLATIELDQEWVDFGNRWALAMEHEELDRQKTATKVIRSAYDASVKRVNNLLDSLAMANDEELREQINTKLQKEIQTKKKFKSQLDSVDQRFDESVELTIRTINFASTARKRFAAGNFEEKKFIIQAVGSNLILYNKKITMHQRKPFSFIQKAVAINSSRLEPKEKIDLSANQATLQPQDTVMRALLNDLRTYWSNNYGIEQRRVKALINSNKEGRVYA